MSAATATAGNNVRSLAEIRADMARSMANRPESLLRDVRDAMTYLPRQAGRGARRAAQFMRLPQIYNFARKWFNRFLNVVGRKLFVAEMLTSLWGQAAIRGTVKLTYKVAKTAVKWSWNILTSPLRLFGPTRNALNRFNTKVSSWTTYSPETNNVHAAIGGTALVVGHYVSAERRPIRVLNTAIGAVMAIRITRRFVPAGFFRWLAYGADAVVTGLVLRNDLEGTRIGNRLRIVKKHTEAEVKGMANDLIADASSLTREAAEARIIEMHEKADTAEANAQAEMAAATAEAEQLRSAAHKLQDSIDQQEAARIAAEAAQASSVVETAAVAVIVEEKPAPTPVVVPPAPGGAAPGPVTPSPASQGQPKQTPPGPPKHTPGPQKQTPGGKT